MFHLQVSDSVFCSKSSFDLETTCNGNIGGNFNVQNAKLNSTVTIRPPGKILSPTLILLLLLSFKGSFCNQ